MKARCPYCLNENPAECEYCESGEIVVNLAEGALYLLLCREDNCGQEIGGRIVDGGENLPLLSEDLKAIRKCPFCKGRASYEFAGMSGPCDLPGELETDL